MADPQVKACPVCGGSPFVFNDDHYGRGWLVECRSDDCALSGPQRSTEAEAIAAWNKLASVDPVANRYNDEWSAFGPFEQEIGDDLFGIQAHVRKPCLDSNDPGTEPVTGPGPDGRYGTLPVDLAEHIVDCHNALRGRNPDALGEFIQVTQDLANEVFEAHGDTPAWRRFTSVTAKFRREASS